MLKKSEFLGFYSLMIQWTMTRAEANEETGRPSVDEGIEFPSDHTHDDVAYIHVERSSQNGHGINVPRWSFHGQTKDKKRQKLLSLPSKRNVRCIFVASLDPHADRWITNKGQPQPLDAIFMTISTLNNFHLCFSSFFAPNRSAIRKTRLNVPLVHWELYPTSTGVSVWPFRKFIYVLIPAGLLEPCPFLPWGLCWRSRYSINLIDLIKCHN